MTHWSFCDQGLIFHFSWIPESSHWNTHHELLRQSVRERQEGREGPNHRRGHPEVEGDWRHAYQGEGVSRKKDWAGLHYLLFYIIDFVIVPWFLLLSLSFLIGSSILYRCFSEGGCIWHFISFGPATVAPRIQWEHVYKGARSSSVACNPVIFLGPLV